MNSQDAEADVDVAVVRGVPVHVGETTVLTVTDDETVVGTVGENGASPASIIVLGYPYPANKHTLVVR